MKFEDSIACQCRYGDIAGRIFKNSEIIWEHSEADYQGSANILVQLPDGKFAHYSWTYGSCSGCDEWEDRGLNDDEIETIMREYTNFFNDEKELMSYLKLEKQYKNARFPCGNSSANGGITTMFKYICGGFGDDFEAMRKSFVNWSNKKINNKKEK